MNPWKRRFLWKTIILGSMLVFGGVFGIKFPIFFLGGKQWKQTIELLLNVSPPREMLAHICARTKWDPYQLWVGNSTYRGDQLPIHKAIHRGPTTPFITTRGPTWYPSKKEKYHHPNNHKMNFESCERKPQREPLIHFWLVVEPNPSEKICSSNWIISPGIRGENKKQVGVSKNNGTPKSSILIGFCIINHLFWGTTIFGNIQVWNHHPDFCCDDSTAFHPSVFFNYLDELIFYFEINSVSFQQKKQ